MHCKPNEHAEADFVGDEIKRLIAFSGGMLNWNDFAILRTFLLLEPFCLSLKSHPVRYNALSRPIEAAFQKQGIPMRMLAGQKFFDRAEVRPGYHGYSKPLLTWNQVKDVLAYLQLVDNPRYDPAFHRIINVPLRALGEKVCVVNAIFLPPDLTPFRSVHSRDQDPCKVQRALLL